MSNILGFFRMPANGDEVLNPEATAPDIGVILNDANDGSAIADATELTGVIGTQATFTQTPTVLDAGKSPVWTNGDGLGGGVVLDEGPYIRLHNQTSGDLAINEGSFTMVFRRTIGRLIFEIGQGYLYLSMTAARLVQLKIWEGAYVTLSDVAVLPDDGGIHTITIRWKKDGATGIRELYVDGVPSADNVTGADTSSMDVKCDEGFDIGIGDSVSGSVASLGGTVYSACLYTTSTIAAAELAKIHGNPIGANITDMTFNSTTPWTTITRVAGTAAASWMNGELIYITGDGGADWAGTYRITGVAGNDFTINKACSGSDVTGGASLLKARTGDPLWAFRPPFATFYPLTSYNTNILRHDVVLTGLPDATLDYTFRVHFGTDPAVLDQTSALSAVMDAGDRVVRFLGGMSPNTRYYFQIAFASSADGYTAYTQMTGTTYEFVSRPSDGAGRLVLAIDADPHLANNLHDGVVGGGAPADLNKRWKNFATVAGGTRKADCWISLGDWMAFFPYKNRVADDASAIELYGSFRNMAGRLTGKMSNFMVRGNHDGHGDQGSHTNAELQVMDAAGRNAMFYVDNAGVVTEEYWDQVVGPCHLIGLDPYIGSPDRGTVEADTWTLGTTQKDWLHKGDETGVLETTTSPVVVIFCHHWLGGWHSTEGTRDYGRGGIAAAYNAAGAGNEPNDTEQDIWLRPKLEALAATGKIVLFCYGHDHLFHHGEHNGVHYIECGSVATELNVDQASTGYQEPGARNTTEAPGYVELDITPTQVTARFVKTNSAYDETSPADQTVYSATIGNSRIGVREHATRAHDLRHRGVRQLAVRA